MIYRGIPKSGTGNLSSLLPSSSSSSFFFSHPFDCPVRSYRKIHLLLALVYRSLLLPPSGSCRFFGPLITLFSSVSSPRLARRFFSSDTDSPREFRLFWQPPPHLSHPTSTDDELTKATRNPISPITRTTSASVYKPTSYTDNRQRIDFVKTHFAVFRIDWSIVMWNFPIFNKTLNINEEMIYN